MDVGSVGLWTFQLDLQSAAEARAAAAEVEAQGWGTLWIPEAVGREALSHAQLLLDATSEMVVATGVANVWSRSAAAAANAQRLLADDSGGRFLLGLGVSHQPMVEGLLGQSYEKPLAKMVSYLDQLDDAFTSSPRPAQDPPRVLAALGPKMLHLAAERSWGALTYFVPVEHTPLARQALGDVPMLMVEQGVVLTTDPAVARDLARRHLQLYLSLPNYVNNLRRLGWDDEDLTPPGSDKLADALVVWGDVDDVVARVKEHHDAGADHVCLQVFTPDATAVPIAEWRELAAALVPPRPEPVGVVGKASPRVATATARKVAKAAQATAAKAAPGAAAKATAAKAAKAAKSTKAAKSARAAKGATRAATETAKTRRPPA
jgi:probable F420-dependent oxidoreductase